MPRFGVVVEGTYDESALKELIKKCDGPDCDFEVRQWGQRGGVMRKFINSLEEFRHLAIDKALVVRDADRKNAQVLRTQMEEMIAGRDYPFVVRIEIVVQELEAWLLADHDAISAVTGRPVNRIPDPIEELDDPKERLRDILSEASPKLAYTAEQAARIAVATDIDRIATRCPSFRRFCLDVRDC